MSEKDLETRISSLEKRVATLEKLLQDQNENFVKNVETVVQKLKKNDQIGLIRR